MVDMISEVIHQAADDKSKEIITELALIYNSSGKIDLSDILKVCGFTQKQLDDLLKEKKSKSPKDK